MTIFKSRPFRDTSPIFSLFSFFLKNYKISRLQELRLNNVLNLMAVYEQYMIWAVLDLDRASNRKRPTSEQLINEANCSYVDSTVDFYS